MFGWRSAVFRRIGIKLDPNLLISDQGKEYAIYNQAIGFDYEEF